MSDQDVRWPDAFFNNLGQAEVDKFRGEPDRRVELVCGVCNRRTVVGVVTEAEGEAFLTLWDEHAPQGDYDYAKTAWWPRPVPPGFAVVAGWLRDAPRPSFTVNCPRHGNLTVATADIEGAYDKAVNSGKRRRLPAHP